MKYILDFDALLFTVTLGLYICTMEVAENLNTYSSSQTVRSLDTQKITQKTYMELFISKLRTLLAKIACGCICRIWNYSFLNYSSILQSFYEKILLIPRDVIGLFSFHVDFA